jgi:hypothetical protein
MTYVHYVPSPPLNAYEEYNSAHSTKQMIRQKGNVYESLHVLQSMGMVKLMPTYLHIKMYAGGMSIFYCGERVKYCSWGHQNEFNTMAYSHHLAFSQPFFPLDDG